MASFVAKWRAEYPKLRIWAEKAENVLTFYEFPEGLRRLIYTNSRIGSFNKQIERLVKKQIQFVTEEALEKRIVSMFLHYNEGVGRRKVRRWREITLLGLGSRPSFAESKTRSPPQSRR
ncbi:MAG: transposase [Bacilli bacterium]|nr:transposase [Bacilli bacterium]